jgi:hypothetical protein
MAAGVYVVKSDAKTTFINHTLSLFEFAETVNSAAHPVYLQATLKRKYRKSRGQITITQSDIELIPDIIDSYSYLIKNIIDLFNNSCAAILSRLMARVTSPKMIYIRNTHIPRKSQGK